MTAGEWLNTPGHTIGDWTCIASEPENVIVSTRGVWAYLHPRGDYARPLVRVQTVNLDPWGRTLLDFEAWADEPAEDLAAEIDHGLDQFVQFVAWMAESTDVDHWIRKFKEQAAQERSDMERIWGPKGEQT